MAIPENKTTAEYISKYRAKRFICDLCNECYPEPCDEPDDCEWMSLINSEPNVTGKIIEYARWEYNPNGHDWGLGAWQCTVCHGNNENLPSNYPDINPLLFSGSKFCPHCGRTMIGVKK